MLLLNKYVVFSILGEWKSLTWVICIYTKTCIEVNYGMEFFNSLKKGTLYKLPVSYFQKEAGAMEITHYPDIPSGLTYQWGTHYN